MKKRMLVLLETLMVICLTALPALANCTLDYFKAHFSESLAVYSGPGKNYYRANKGKALYGLNTIARVYGCENGWIMMGYELGSGDYRIGYVEGSAGDAMYQASGELEELRFDYSGAYINRECSLTDDPVINTKSIATIPSGTFVSYLASMDGVWAYIEWNGTIGLTRGFVPLSRVTVGYGPVVTPAPVVTPRPSSGGGVPAAITAGRMSTRSGPATAYTEELGTFPSSTQITAIERVTDAGGTEWTLVDFYAGGRHVRAYTGTWRIQPEGYTPQGSTQSYQVMLSSNTPVFYGPGGDYALRSETLSAGTVVDIYDNENGYCLCDYTLSETGERVRGYIPEGCLSGGVDGGLRAGR